MRYFLLHIKRMWKAFPAILATTLILAGALGILSWVQTMSASGDEQRQKITLALVGDSEDPTIGIGVSLMQEMDSSRFTCTLVDMEEDEARQALERQEIQGYLLIPEDFIQSVMYGDNDKVTFVTGTSQYTIGTLLARELADAVSTLLTETQSGIYAFQRFSKQEGATKNLDDRIYDINVRYFNYILPRAELFDIDTPDSTAAISYQGYYFCSVFLLFFLFLGIPGCHLFVQSDYSLCRLLHVRGQGALWQTLSEYGACCFLLLLSYITAAVSLGVASAALDLTLPEFSNFGAFDYTGLFFSFGLVIPLAAGILYLLSQVVKSLISGVILIFSCVLCLGYISGCFYPLSFFPEGVQKAAVFLPTGALMEYLQDVVTGESAWIPGLITFAWILALFAAAWGIRSYRLSR